jgi:hypothetical protein
VENPFAETFAKLYGLPCWGVEPGYGLSLTLEFGDPHLEIREPRPPQAHWSRRFRAMMARRRVFVHGEWHLWLWDCDWAVFLDGRRVGDCSGLRRVRRAAEVLDGQALVSAEVRARGCRTTFGFDLGGRLETRPLNRRGEQWLLYTPSGKVLTLRSDKQYQFARGDGSEGEHWQTLPKHLAL